jgi:hypothetical protein
MMKQREFYCQEGHPMSSPLTNTSDSLDAEIAKDLAVRREKLVRGVRNQRIRARIGFGLSGCIVLFAGAAHLLGDSAAAVFCAVTACGSFGFSYVAGRAAHKRAVDALRQTDRAQ